jgi:hypothetical protein
MIIPNRFDVDIAWKNYTDQDIMVRTGIASTVWGAVNGGATTTGVLTNPTPFPEGFLIGLIKDLESLGYTATSPDPSSIIISWE